MMRTSNFLPIAMALLVGGAAFAAPPPHNPMAISYLANDLNFTLSGIVQQEANMGGFSWGYNQLMDFSNSAQRFAYSQSYGDYMQLENSYRNSRQSWPYLKSYAYNQSQFSRIDYNMQSIKQYFNQPPIPPVFPPHPSQIFTVLGQGKGGTKVGNYAASCQRAQQRAQDDANFNCASQSGQVVSSSVSACSCHWNHDDYNCAATATAQCRRF